MCRPLGAPNSKWLQAVEHSTCSDLFGETKASAALLSVEEMGHSSGELCSHIQ